MSATRTPTPAPPPPPPEPGTFPTERELAAWQLLCDYLQQHPLAPDTAPTIATGTPPALMEPIQTAHQVGLLTAMNTAGVVISFNIHVIVGAVTGSIYFCQWKYYQQGFQYGINQRFTVIRTGQTN